MRAGGGGVVRWSDVYFLKKPSSLLSGGWTVGSGGIRLRQVGQIVD